MKKILTPIIIILLIGIVCILVSSNLNWSKKHWQGMIAVDATGYYAYLPATFIYQDPHFKFLDTVCRKKYDHPFHDYEYRVNSNGKSTNKYFIGTAVLQTPFFLIAHGLSFLSGDDSDGYSIIYMILLQIGTIFYMLLGLFFLNRVLKLYQTNSWIRIFTLVVITLGTNVFHYVTEEPGMSHVYSFSIVTMFIFYSKSYFSTFRRSDLIRIGFIFGLILIIRPVNGLVILSLPFLAESWGQFKIGWLKTIKNYRFLILAFCAIFLMVFLQSLFYYWGTGSFWVYAYGNEKIDLSNPHVFDILFSYKKGLFLYTPIYLMSLFGLWTLWKKEKFQSIAIGLFLFIVTYVLSSWCQWYYGGSFSSRVFIEYLPFFAILLSLFTQSIWCFKRMKQLWLSVIFLLVIVCQLQTYQYRRGQIHWSEMTKEKYWDVFLGWKKVYKFFE